MTYKLFSFILLLIIFPLQCQVFATITITNDAFSGAGSASGSSDSFAMYDAAALDTTTVGARTSSSYSGIDGFYGYLQDAGVTYTNWYFAEGSTAGSFDQWLLVLNPSSSEVTVTPTFYYSDSATETGDALSVPAQSRYSLHINDLINSSSALSAKLAVTGSSNIYTARSMYWDVSGSVWAGGHGSIGINETAATWYFAEGCTKGFDEWILIFNPNESAAEVTLSLMTETGLNSTHTVSVPATSRVTVHITDLITDGDVAAKLESSGNVGIVAERTIYHNSAGYSWLAGHCTRGATATSTTWYFAEGRATEDFAEYILLLNPDGNSAATVQMTFVKSDDTTIAATVSVPAQSRKTINVNNIVTDSELAAKIESTNGVGIVAERAMYWNSGIIEWAGSHCSLGAAATSNVWYFAEGSTSGSFSEWLILYNPDSSNTAEVTVTFMLTDGTNEIYETTILAESRVAIDVDTVVNDASFSIKVESTNSVSIVAEQSRYWNSGGLDWAAGSCTKGINVQE